jgi:putative component of toxin-antitoxin plasmid stabilization module
MILYKILRNTKKKRKNNKKKNKIKIRLKKIKNGNWFIGNMLM